MAATFSVSGQSASTNGPSSVQPATVKDYLTSHLSYYEPIYFIVGSSPAAEFQISLKYEVFTYTNGWAQNLNNFYFGYTQTSFWNLITNDPAFYDTSYKPSAFLYYTNIFRAPGDNLFHTDMQGGFEHESNGRGGTLERSLYTLYAQPTFTYGRAEGWQIALKPRAWIYTMVGDNNRDIPAYRGYADLIATISKGTTAKWGGMELMTTFHLGDQGTHPGLKFDFFFDLPRFLGFNPALQVEYFTGYGQTLLQYNTYSHGIRGGLCLWYK